MCKTKGNGEGIARANCENKNQVVGQVRKST